MKSNALEELVSVCPDPVIGINKRGVVTHFNRAAARLLGYKPNDILGKMSIVRLYSSAESGSSIMKALHSEECGDPGQVEGYETSVKAADGRHIPIRLSATILYKDDEEIGSIGFFHDLTSRNEMEATLKRLSITDSLTGLHNQGYFHTVLEDEIGRAHRYNRSTGLICMDMDRFKQVNDQHGHLEGDKVICYVAKILKSSLRNSDLAFRYGGDEFMVVLPEATTKESVQLAERIRLEFTQSWEKSRILGTKSKIKPSLSLGVAELNRGENAESFIRRADHAMYQAKKNGGNQVSVSTPDAN